MKPILTILLGILIFAAVLFGVGYVVERLLAK